TSGPGASRRNPRTRRSPPLVKVTSASSSTRYCGIQRSWGDRGRLPAVSTAGGGAVRWSGGRVGALQDAVGEHVAPAVAGAALPVYGRAVHDPRRDALEQVVGLRQQDAVELEAHDVARGVPLDEIGR